MSYYISHYFNIEKMGLFLLVSFLGLGVILGIVIGAARFQIQRRIQTGNLSQRAARRITKEHRFKELSIIESFYEMVFSSTSVLFFLCLYYIIDEKIPAAAVYWQKYQDFLLLAFLVLSVFLTSWLDIVFVELDHIEPAQKASVRLVSSFYIILILLYIKFIYNDDNYDSLILYFVTLAIGRFIYFDFTMDDFLHTVRGVAQNLPLLLLMGGYSGFVCWFGFKTGFLLTSNGVLLSTLLAHIFMDISIFILFRTKLVRLALRL